MSELGDAKAGLKNNVTPLPARPLALLLRMMRIEIDQVDPELLPGDAMASDTTTPESLRALAAELAQVRWPRRPGTWNVHDIASVMTPAAWWQSDEAIGLQALESQLRLVARVLIAMRRMGWTFSAPRAEEDRMSSSPDPVLFGGNDPTTCDHIYPTTRDGRCHGCAAPAPKPEG